MRGQGDPWEFSDVFSGEVKESFTGVIRERGYQTQSERLCIPDHISMQEVCSSLPMHGLLPLFMKRREDMYLLSRIDDKLDVPYLFDYKPRPQTLNV